MESKAVKIEATETVSIDSQCCIQNVYILVFLFILNENRSPFYDRHIICWSLKIPQQWWHQKRRHINHKCFSRLVFILQLIFEMNESGYGWKRRLINESSTLQRDKQSQNALSRRCFVNNKLFSSFFVRQSVEHVDLFAIFFSLGPAKNQGWK